MKNYRPLLFENLDLRLAGFHISCLRLNRHAPEAEPDPHRHDDHGQILVYLSGTGWQDIDGARTPARPGTVIYVAPGQLHAFERQRSRRPLCLVFDIAIDRDRPAVNSVAQLNATDLTRVRARLSSLFGLGAHDPEAMLLKLGAGVLDILDPALSALGCLGKNRPPMPSSRITRRVERALATADRESQNPSLGELARRLGYQHDYLNRQLQAECGLTLGQLRPSARLEHAQRLLRDHRLSISAVAERVGLLDNNYFARWFKQQTGMSPSAWRAG